MTETYIFNNQYFKFPEWACFMCRVFIQCKYCCNKGMVTEQSQIQG